MSASEPVAAEPRRQAPRTPRLRRLAKRLALLACTLLAMAVAAEIATRLLSDTVPPLTVKDPTIGQHYLPSFEAEVYVPEAERKVLLRFNELGFRGPDRPYEKPPGVRRIAVLGDSMIASLGVDEQDTMVCRLEQMLSASSPEARWEVLNFGVSGASPGQELVLYRELVWRFEPDIVLCAFFVGNDLADNCRRLSNNPRIYFDLDEEGNLVQLPFSASRARLGYYLNRYSRFYVWQKEAVNKTRKEILKQTGTLAPGEWIFCRQQSEKLAYAWRLSDRIHRAFRDEAQRRGALFAVVLIPSGWQVYDDVFQTIAEGAGELAPQFDRAYPDERLGALCRQADIPFLSMLADFQQAAPSASAEVRQEWLFHQGNGHFNEHGNELAARTIHRFLTRGDSPQLGGRPLVTRLR